MSSTMFNKPLDTEFVGTVNGLSERIDDVNNKIGTVPSGKTVEGQISTLSEQIVPLTKGKSWTNLIQPTLVNGSHYSSGCWYGKFGCFVVVIVSAQFDSAPTNELLWTMPQGYIPIGNAEIVANGGGSYNAKARCTITNTGEVRCTSVDRWIGGYGIYILAN